MGYSQLRSVQELSGHVRVTVNVKPRSRENKLIIEPDGTITLNVEAPPRQNKANRMVVRFLAKKLGKTTSQVRIVAGLRANIKVVEIASMSRGELSRLIVGDTH
jgi:hypothetical protein